MSGPRMLRGVVRLRDAVPAPCSLHVKVEDVSRADAPSRVVAEAVLPLDRPLRRAAAVPFSLTIPEVAEGVRYSVRAHVDISGSARDPRGRPDPTQAYPVITQDIRTTLSLKSQVI